MGRKQPLSLQEVDLQAYHAECVSCLWKRTRQKSETFFWKMAKENAKPLFTQSAALHRGCNYVVTWRKGKFARYKLWCKLLMGGKKPLPITQFLLSSIEDNDYFILRIKTELKSHGIDEIEIKDLATDEWPWLVNTASLISFMWGNETALHHWHPLNNHD